MTNSEKNFYKKRTKDNLHFSLHGISYKNRMFQGEKHEKTNGNPNSGCTDHWLCRRMQPAGSIRRLNTCSAQ